MRHKTRVATPKQRDLLDNFLNSKQGRFRRLLAAFAEWLRDEESEFFDPYRFMLSSMLYGDLRKSYKIEKKRRRKKYTQIARLKKAGYLRSEKGNDGRWYYTLTSKGWTIALQYFITEARNQKRWDGKWRILIFDIPEKNKHLRNRLRRVLQQCGFQYLQKSVWLTPYDVFEQMKELLNLLGVRPYTMFLITEKVVGDEDIRKKFGL